MGSPGARPLTLRLLGRASPPVAESFPGYATPVLAGIGKTVTPKPKSSGQRTAAARANAYTPQVGFGRYGTTGTHSDYADARHIADPNTRKTYGYTFETGPWVGNARDSFHPVSTFR